MSDLYRNNGLVALSPSPFVHNMFERVPIIDAKIFINIKTGYSMMNAR